jgi:hypothetical protein
MTKIGKKAAQDFFCAVSKVFDRVKTVALWSAKKIKIKRTIKGYGSAARHDRVPVTLSTARNKSLIRHIFPTNHKILHLNFNLTARILLY